MLVKIGDWLDERFSWRDVWEAIFLRKVPHVNWFYTLGSATLFVATTQAITGILLTLYYVPTPDHACASAMVILTVAHLLRVYFLGAYKYPREATWITGVFLLLIVIGFGFTGYLLPWDQKAFWATTVGTRIAGVAPGVGDSILRLLRGGESLSAVTLARFYGGHVWMLPAALLLLLLAHLYLVIRIGISAPPR